VRGRISFRSILLAALGSAVFTTNLAASIVSTFSADLTVSLTFPAPIVNMLAVTTPNPTDAFLPGAVASATGDAGVTQAANPTSNFANNTLTFTAGPIAGFAGSGGGSAQAVSFGTSQTINLNNLTMGMLMIQLSGTYTYHLAATAGPSGAAGASFSFEVDNTSDPTTVVLYGPTQNAVIAPPNSTAMCNNCAIAAFNVAIPPGITSINVDPFVSGEAFNMAPEPSMLIPVCCVVAGILAISRRGRAANN
jgi:hypothetical protein